MHRTVVLNVVGLTGELLGDATPNLKRLAREGAMRPLQTVVPAVTCTVQSTFTTGLLPSGHGCVANGWYFRDIAEVNLWRQANQLVAGEKIWETARRLDPSFTCAKLFWWYNMYSSADYAVTPRPIYWADGLKLPDIYTEPASLRDELVFRLGEFPLFNFWGPNANIKSTQWIARCARHVYDTRRPTLTLVYLPHLDYNLQRLGPDHPAIQDDLRAVDAACGELIDHVRNDGTRVMVLSEYGITRVSGVVHINRVLREHGLLRVRVERGLEKLDAGGSDAFAVADHQVAHVYVRRSTRVAEVRSLIEALPGVEAVLDEEGKRAMGLLHPRSGELVAIAKQDRWFSYYYWLDDDKAPEFARTVDIHRKPGYDPVELFVDPRLSLAPARALFTLAKKKLGFRYLMRLTPLNSSLVQGSHGRLTDRLDQGPVFLTSEPHLAPPDVAHACDIKGIVLSHLTAG
ncbi:nucleotide pyrophosphatase/phosphodiesterase family protein [Sorangium sp. So ce1014]|uniref:alkaline phosphatase family protein n=1 Tax=Sorangium sp. So ce1014 TaxID=3133326 RepID=UPI003F5F2D0E